MNDGPFQELAKMPPRNHNNKPHHIMKTKHLTRTVLLISMVAFSPTAFAEDAVADKRRWRRRKRSRPVPSPRLIGDSITFATLTKALKAAELDLTLGTKGEYTIFAPTDEAFGKLPAEVLTKLMLPENKEKLRSLLLYHVIAGRMLAADLKDGEMVKTMNGEKVEIDAGDDKIEIDGSKVFSADVVASNGVMHSIGTVLVPESLDGFADLEK